MKKSRSIEKVLINKKVLDEKAPIQVGIVGNIDSVTNWLAKRVVKPFDPSRIKGSFEFHREDERTEMNAEEVAEQLTETEEENNGISREKKKALLNGLGVLVGKMEQSLEYDSGNMVDQKYSHVLIDRDEMSILLVLNETNPYEIGEVKGKLSMHSDFMKWKINQPGSDWDHDVLGEFIKMNRNAFTDRDTAMRLSTELKQLQVNVDKQIEKNNDRRGNYKAIAIQQVKSMSIPDRFEINVPIFKGQAKSKIEVEIYIDANTYRITLVSPDANDIIASVRDNIIDEQKSLIQSLAPDIVIIEQ